MRALNSIQTINKYALFETERKVADKPIWIYENISSNGKINVIKNEQNDEKKIRVQKTFTQNAYTSNKIKVKVKHENDFFPISFCNDFSIRYCATTKIVAPSVLLFFALFIRMESCDCQLKEQLIVHNIDFLCFVGEFASTLSTYSHQYTKKYIHYYLSLVG